MGKKYIIDLNPDCVEGEYLRIPARIAGEEQWLVTKAALTPYTEPDLEQVRIEAYEDGYKTAKVQCNIQAEKDMREVGERHYQRGLADAKCGYENGFENGMIVAWDAAKKIALMDTETSENVTGYFGLFRIMENLTPMQAIEKIRQYEQEKDAEIKIGNEVKAFEKKPFIVTGFGYGDDEEDVYCHGFVTENGISTSAKKNSCVRTGRHFPEIAEIFEKMRGEQDG